jgi:nitroreductase
MEQKELIAAFSELIRTRRSVKPGQFAPGRLDDALIHTLLEAARWAPTHAMTQPWRFSVFCDEGIGRFTKFRQEVYRHTTPEDQFSQVKFDKIEGGADKCSHIILMGMKRQESGKLPEWEEVAAVASAAQNMQLMAAAMGIGAYWSTGAMSTHPAMLELLGLSDGDLPLGMLMLGQLGTLPETPERFPEEAFTVWYRK